MNSLGDLLAKLGKSAGLQNSEINQLRQKGLDLDRAEAIAASMSTWVMPGGGISPHFFSDARIGFGDLPAELASMVHDSNQSLDNGVLTTITYEATANLGTNATRFDFQYGITRDVAAGSFSVKGQVGNVWLFCGAVQWEVNATGARELRLISGSGGNTPIGTIQGMAGVSICTPFCIMRQMTTADDTHVIKGYQNSGGSLAITHAVFGALRVL